MNVKISLMQYLNQIILLALSLRRIKNWKDLEGTGEGNTAVKGWKDMTEPHTQLFLANGCMVQRKDYWVNC